MRPTQRRMLLVNPPFERFYAGTVIKNVAPSTVPLSLACLGAGLLEDGHSVRVFDFNLSTEDDFSGEVRAFAPDYVGITFVTPLIREADRICRMAKALHPPAVLIGGGPHCSSFPESSLRETMLDVAAVGEGDFTLRDIVAGVPLPEIRGIAFKSAEGVTVNERRGFIEDLDVLPMPAYGLFEIDRYRVSPALARRNPVAWLETSRGCVYDCIYCNKNCFGRTFRVKSPARVAEEFERAGALGFREIFLTDDGFSTDLRRAKEICALLSAGRTQVPWSPLNGIRADRTDPDLLHAMRAAGCYRIYLGIESGSQRVLDRIRKGTTLEQVRNTVRWAKQAGLEIVGYFMLGLPGDTEETMGQTIDFALSLDLDLAKAAITIPLPGTEMYRDLCAAGAIKTGDWETYRFHSTPSVIYDHESLPWPVVQSYYRRFYRKIYMNPRFVLRNVLFSIRNRTLLENLKLAFSINWLRIQ